MRHKHRQRGYLRVGPWPVLEIIMKINRIDASIKWVHLSTKKRDNKVAQLARMGVARSEQVTSARSATEAERLKIGNW